MSWFEMQEIRLVLHLHIQPGAKQTEIAGLYGEALKIRLAAPPVDGKANAALLAFIAQTFAVPLRQVSLKAGAASRRKTVIVENSPIDPASLLTPG
ncbi:DUF167 domain-containing protein [Silvimonas soli]|uniref:DUF167 domain-containing protein n=1 Tax=Silvimonas soli TaxID=2980100 RepID=UPI0024B396CF|nr:DUF167 family protein [Silvimonas soli]